MAQPARLITPRGKTIELSPEVYERVKQLIPARSRRMSKEDVGDVIESFYGKYAGGKSLTDALLAEHARERARDELRLARLHE